jgi:phosphatidylinositol alpha-mannosyltransferase
MKSLKIAFFFSSDPAKTGGVQEHILFLSKELKARGHTVDIYGPESKSNYFENYTSIGNIIDVPVINGNVSNILLLDPQLDLKKIFLNKKYDIIHLHEPYKPFAFWGLVKILNAPFVNTFHTAWDNSSIINSLNGVIPFFKDLFSKYADGAIFVSKIAQTRWESLCGPLVKQRIIYNSVDTHIFTAKKGVNSPPHLLYVARLVQRKGIFQLLKAIKILKEKGLEFVLTIMGDGTERDKMIQLIEEYHIAKYVHYVGEIKGKKRAIYYKNADIFCAPYRDEAGPLAILEAISAGLPIVGFSNELFKETLKDYPNKNLLVNPNSVEDLAKALQFLITHPDEILRIKAWCLEKKKTFSWQTIAQQTEELYFELIKK